MSKKNQDDITTREIYELVDKTRTELKSDISTLQSKIDDHYVTKDEFDPIKRLVYGLVGLILIAVFSSLVALVIKQ